MSKFIESKDIEFKREINEGIEREAIAFLNSREGGTIVFGVDAKEQIVVGIGNPDDLQLQLKDRLKNNIEPSVMGLFDLVVEVWEEKHILRLVLASGFEKPYYLKKYGMTEKGCFQRVGSSCEPMPRDHIDQLYSRRIRNTIENLLPRERFAIEPSLHGKS